MGEFFAFSGIVLVIVIVKMIWEEAPWIFVLAGIGIVTYLIKDSKRKKSSDVGGYVYTPTYDSDDTYEYSNDTPSNDSIDSTSSNDTFLYRGRTTTWEPVLATVRGENIFEGYNSGLQMFSYIKATYHDGWVYDGTVTGMFGTVLGRYDNEGNIYLGSSISYNSQVGLCKNGYVYRGNSTSGEIIGCFEGDAEAAAAAAIVFLFS